MAYIANFPLRYGDMCTRNYKTLAVAKREITKAYKRFEAPERFYATIHYYDRVTKEKKIILEVWM